MTGLSRREFLGAAGSAAAGVALSQSWGRVFAQGRKKSRVVDVGSSRWLTGDGRVAGGVVGRMVHEGVRRLTGAPTPGAAWRRLFSPTEVVCLKFNRISRDFTGANQALVDALVAGLVEAGLKRQNIIVVEATNVSFDGGEPRGGWAGEYDFGSGKTRLSNLLVNQVDAVINVPNLKHHPLAGFTGALKNISHANDTIMEGPNRFHRNNCDPYIADINAIDVVREKLRLHLMNGLKGIFDRGAHPPEPRHQWGHNGLLLGLDPVAMDTHGVQLVEKARAHHTRAPLEEVGLPPRYLATAADRGLGTNDLGRIELVRVTV